jgi:hypothetical protein
VQPDFRLHGSVPLRFCADPQKRIGGGRASQMIRAAALAELRSARGIPVTKSQKRNTDNDLIR